MKVTIACPIRRSIGAVSSVGQEPECLTRQSSSQQQDNQDDQEDCAKTTTDIRAAVIEATTAEQNQKNNYQDYQVHNVCPLAALLSTKRRQFVRVHPFSTACSQDSTGAGGAAAVGMTSVRRGYRNSQRRAG